MKLIKFGDIPLYVRESFEKQDSYVAKEVLIDDCYQVRNLPKIRTCIDIGAHIGSFGSLLHHYQPNVRLLSVEANWKNWPVLSRNTVGQILCAACSYVKEPVLIDSIPNIHDCKATGGSYIFNPQKTKVHPPEEYCTQTRVDCVTLEDCFAKLNIDYLDLLKIDCEGSEYNIFENTTKLDKIALIIGEYHDGSDRLEKILGSRFHINWLSGRDSERGLFSASAR